MNPHNTNPYKLLQKLSFPRFGGTSNVLNAAILLQKEISILGDQSELMPFEIPAYELESCKFRCISNQT